MANSEKGSHILVFPFPAQGHMLPLLDLTHHLANYGLTITILVTPNNLPTLNPLLSSCPNIEPLVLPFPPHPSVPSGVENVKDIGLHGNVPIINSLANLQDPIIQWFSSHPNPPVAIVSDFFLGWTHHLADKLMVPRFCFFSSGAFLTAVLDYCSCRNVSSDPSQNLLFFPDLPNSPSFECDHIPGLFWVKNKSDPEKELVMDGFTANASSSGWVVNTFDALESRYMEYLTKLLGHGRVFGVGPVSLLSRSDPMTCGQSESGSGFDVVRWLDGRPDGSVVYVCFGSQKFLTSDQMEALAIGLEDSGIHYVWVVKPEKGGSVRVWSNRGFVIRGWAPQVEILSHLSRGWVSESLWVELGFGIDFGWSHDTGLAHGG